MSTPRLPLPCLCGRLPEVSQLYAWVVSCPECYDGAPDSSTRGHLGAGMCRDEAIDRWNDLVDDLRADEEVA